MIWDALASGHPLGVLSGLLQLGAIVFVFVVGILFHRTEKKAEAERWAKTEPLDLSDVPPFIPDEDR